jgi:hypothetical protein
MPLWESEFIEDHWCLFYRVHVNQVPTGQPGPTIFSEKHGGMSTNWEKYADARHTRRTGPQPANKYGIMRLGVGAVRSVEGLAVAHTPDEKRNNQAHTDVRGLGSTNREIARRRVLLFAAIKQDWEISPSEPPE